MDCGGYLLLILIKNVLVIVRIGTSLMSTSFCHFPNRPVIGGVASGWGFYQDILRMSPSAPLLILSRNAGRGVVRTVTGSLCSEGSRQALRVSVYRPLFILPYGCQVCTFFIHGAFVLGEWVGLLGGCQFWEHPTGCWERVFLEAKPPDFGNGCCVGKGRNRVLEG